MKSLATTRKKLKNIQEIVTKVYRDEDLTRVQLYYQQAK
jgi:hypothetical protein